jgi:hypothetical protein
VIPHARPHVDKPVTRAISLPNVIPDQAPMPVMPQAFKPRASAPINTEEIERREARSLSTGSDESNHTVAELGTLPTQKIKKADHASISVESNTHCEGFMYRYEINKKDWKRRFFMLIEGVMNVYKKKAPSDKKIILNDNFREERNWSLRGFFQCFLEILKRKLALK